MFRKILLIVLMGLLFKLVGAQQHKAMLIQLDTSDEHLSEYYVYWLQPFDQPDDVRVADSMWGKDAFKNWKWYRSLSLGDARKRLWVRIAVMNVSSGTNDLVLSINDFMDTATLYISTDTGFIKVCSDSYWKIASRRLFPTRPLFCHLQSPGASGGSCICRSPSTTITFIFPCTL